MEISINIVALFFLLKANNRASLDPELEFQSILKTYEDKQSEKLKTRKKNKNVDLLAHGQILRFF